MARTAAVGHEAPETRDLILQAALQTFSERGFDGSSTREIAAEAGVNHGLIPYYFGSKEKLWKAAVDLAFGDMKVGLDAILADPSIADDRRRAGRLIRSHVRFVARRPEFVRLMHEEGKRRGPRMRWIVDRHVKPMYEAIASLLVRARTRGPQDIDFSPVHFFYVLAGASGVIFHQAEECRRLTGVDPFDSEVVEEHARVVEWLLLGPPDDAAAAPSERSEP